MTRKDLLTISEANAMKALNLAITRKIIITFTRCASWGEKLEYKFEPVILFKRNGNLFIGGGVLTEQENDMNGMWKEFDVYEIDIESVKLGPISYIEIRDNYFRLKKIDNHFEVIISQADD